MRTLPLAAAAALAACASAPTPPPAPPAADAGRPPAMTSAADPAVLEQYAATYRFRHGRPVSIVVTPRGDAVLFLRSGPRSFVRDLWSHDVATGEEKVLLTADALLAGAEETLTAAEAARRERMRLAAKGIAGFQLSEDGEQLLVPLSGRLYVVERATGKVRALPPSPSAPTDARFSPDGSRVALTRDGDLFVVDVASGKETRLTTRARESITHGEAEFVAQEEMSRFEGFWWSPDGKHLAYAEADTSGVETVHIADPMRPERAPHAWPYPRAGRANAKVRLGVVPASGGKTVWAAWDAASHPYLATVRWPEGGPLVALVQDRLQRDERLLSIDPATGATRELLRETDAAWLNLDQDVPKHRKDGKGFLWTSEREGEVRLELRGPDGAHVRWLEPKGFGHRALLRLAPDASAAWVVASPDPTESHVWRVPLDGGAPERLTEGRAEHGAAFSKASDVWVEVADGPGGPRWRVRRGKDVLHELRSVAEAPPFSPAVEHLVVDGPRPYRAAIVRPRTFDPALRYPVVLSVYGGPGHRVVGASRDRFLLAQWIADHGFVVVSLDGRGTPFQGRDWERAIAGKLGDVPLDDQVEGLAALGKRFPELDLGRVGVYGWSFGGYLSALATMRRPDVFRAGVAGAPVADWRDYDTHYTERYLGLPDADAAAYDRASALTYAGALTRPLLLVHGTADDNVYFLHSLRLSDALFRAGKDHSCLPLSGFTHMVPDPLVTTRLYGRIVSFLRAELGAPAPR